MNNQHPNDPDAPAWMVEAAFWLLALPPLFLIALHLIDGPQAPDYFESEWYVSAN